jgi:hypothetical protein
VCLLSLLGWRPWRRHVWSFESACQEGTCEDTELSYLLETFVEGVL